MFGSGRLPSVQSSALHTFSRAPQAHIQRSVFDRTHGVKTTFNAGYIVPILVDEALPGDSFNCHLNGFARMSTPVFPLMDNLYMETFFFAVPYRLVWNNWEKFNGAQTDPGDSTDYVIPQVVAPAVTGWTEGTLSDYFGLPVGVASITQSTLWHRAYNLIWNEWFRDQNLQDSVVVDKDDGPDTSTDYVLLQRNKRYDYFTSCLPWPQKGPEVELPLGTSAPVIPATSTSSPIFKPSTGTPATYYLGMDGGDNHMFASTGVGTYPAASADHLTQWSSSGLIADLSTATAASINALRLAFQTQRMYERDARGGTRYIEIIKSHFNVTSPDSRLQRPEYLGGGSSPVLFNPVAQTSSTDATTPQGNLASIATCVLNGHGFTKSFTEHCLILGFVNVRADLNYQQGMNRMFSRSTRFDFYWPALAHLGEQAVLNKEIFTQGTAADDEVFGYQERYAEYRYKPSLITGLFRSDATGTLDSWHLAQDFSALPELNSAFIVENPPMSRVKAITTAPDFLFDGMFKYKCARPMPLYSVPGLIDHF